MYSTFAILHSFQDLSVNLDNGQEQIDELRAAAEPLEQSCTPELTQQIHEAVEQAVGKWQVTRTGLKDLCTR